MELFESELGVDLAISDRGDIDIVSAENNLAQAILHRMRTIKGELADIGHGSYGSHFFNLVGEPNNEATRTRIRLAVREILLQEPRIKEIKSIVVRTKKFEAISIPGTAATDAGKERVQLGRFAESPESYEETLTKRGSLSELANSLNTVEIDISIIPLDRQVPLNLVVPFNLEVM